MSHEVGFYQFDIFDCLVISGQWSRLETNIFGFSIVDYPKGGRLPFNNNDIMLVYRSLFKKPVQMPVSRFWLTDITFDGHQ